MILQISSDFFYTASQTRRERRTPVRLRHRQMPHVNGMLGPRDDCECLRVEHNRGRKGLPPGFDLPIPQSQFQNYIPFLRYLHLLLAFGFQLLAFMAASSAQRRRSPVCQRIPRLRPAFHAVQRQRFRCGLSSTTAQGRTASVAGRHSSSGQD